MDWNDDLQAFTYSCPCGDLFSITMARRRHRALLLLRPGFATAGDCCPCCSPRPCPGVQAELVAGESIARCPSCSLFIEVVYEEQQLQKLGNAHPSPAVGTAITA